MARDTQPGMSKEKSLHDRFQDLENAHKIQKAYLKGAVAVLLALGLGGAFWINSVVGRAEAAQETADDAKRQSNEVIGKAKDTVKKAESDMAELNAEALKKLTKLREAEEATTIEELKGVGETLAKEMERRAGASFLKSMPIAMVIAFTCPVDGRLPAETLRALEEAGFELCDGFTHAEAGVHKDWKGVPTPNMIGRFPVGTPPGGWNGTPPTEWYMALARSKEPRDWHTFLHYPFQKNNSEKAKEAKEKYLKPTPVPHLKEGESEIQEYSFAPKTISEPPEVGEVGTYQSGGDLGVKYVGMEFYIKIR